MNRREVITLLGGAVAWPQTVMGQGAKGRRLIGRLSFASRDGALRYTDRFLAGMRELGYVEGRDFDMVYGMANFDTDRLPRVAAQLVELAPDVILAGATLEATAARKATDRIPIVVGALAVSSPCSPTRNL